MKHEITAKKLLKYIGLTILFFVIIGYGLGRGRDLIFGINLIINGISNNETVSSSTVNVTGIAKHALGITINQRPVSVTDDGQWRDTLALLPGINIIKIGAEDKFGRSVSKTFTVNYISPPI